MPEMYKVKITVLKRFSPDEVFKDKPVTPLEPIGACESFSDGQEFIIEGGRMPADFPCNAAWNCMFWMVRTLALDGKMVWYKEENAAVACCIDGLRPVIFKLERIKIE